MNYCCTGRLFSLLALLTVGRLVVAAEPVVDVLVVGVGAAEPSSPESWYGAGVRPSEKRSPEDERLGFHLPPGFEVDLIAAEPAIAKPLNMAFDPRGKLWITQTIEYPYPRGEGEAAGDGIKVLEDTDCDGSFDRVTTFADGLNIPIGVLPYDDGAIVFSIPNILRLRDTDGDGKCDHRETILGPFDTSMDTHGMVNSLRRGDDGWIYACHGFNNRSVVKGSDGHSVTLHSGNTFRFRADGSRVELFTSGQVNPFGMTIERWGNLYSADCHSKPITCLVRGACYPSFGKPDDGLGYFPSMMDHLHGSTAISGLCMYEANDFPAEYRGQLYSGNVMTSRINRDRIEQTGATVMAHELTDFMTSDDPWFRPVDIQLGPEGALYVADFYNRIIGHYEVPLEHPGRDRQSGRIWRIRHSASPALRLYTSGPSDDLEVQFDRLSDANAAIRRLALDALSDVSSDQLVQVQSIANERLKHEHELMRIGAMWLLHRQRSLSRDSLLALLNDPSALVRNHTLRSLAEPLGQLIEDSASLVLPLVRQQLSDPNSNVVASAGQALAEVGEVDDAIILLQRILVTPQVDPMLRARLRISLRDLIVRQPHCVKVLRPQLTGAEAVQIYREVMLGVKTPIVMTALVDELEQDPQVLTASPETINHVAKNALDHDLERLIVVLRQRFQDSPQEARKWLTLLNKSMVGRSSSELLRWANELVDASIERLQAAKQSNLLPIDWRADADANWATENRRAKDGEDDHVYRSSLSLGEKYTGVLRSGVFASPSALSFWLVGHNGVPTDGDARLNRICLIDAHSGEVIQEAWPPRSDVAASASWDLSAISGRPVRLEVIDGDSRGAYAWIAVGRFSTAKLNLSELGEEWNSTLELISKYRLFSQTTPLLSLAKDLQLDVNRRLQAAELFGQLSDQPMTSATAWFLIQFPHDPELEQSFFTSLGNSSSDADFQLIRQGMKSLTQNQQLQLARRFAAHRKLAGWLIVAMEDGLLSPHLLRDQTVATALASTLDETYVTRLATLGQFVAVENAELTALGEKVIRQVFNDPGDAVRGFAVFQKHCLNCHQVGGQGAVVGPQLEGVGARGPERLLEDILWPDRNVDKAFRTSSILLDDATLRVGLIRNENDKVIELIENNGQVSQIDTARVESRHANVRSLMPDGLATTIGVAGLVDLVRYLQSTATPNKPR